MNRAEKRRQQKLAKKAARKGTSSSPILLTHNQQPISIEQAIALGVEHHNAGRLPEAEGFYNQILQADPNQPIALHFLGVIALQVGENDIAVDLIGKALTIKPDYVEAHYNLGNGLQERGNLVDAVASYHKAIAIRPDYVQAHSNLGNVLQEQGKLDDAVASYHRALAIVPDFAEVHCNLGNVLQEQGKLEDAVASYHKALAINPDYVEANSNLGLALQKQGKLDDAVASYNKALAINPDFAEAHYNLGNVHQEQGKIDDAFTHHRLAITLSPQDNSFWAALAQSIRTISFGSVDERLWQDLLNLLDRPTVRPSEIIGPIISALAHHQEFSHVFRIAESIEPDSNIAYQPMAAQLSTIPLFLRLIALTPINDLKIERVLSLLRRSMLQETLAGNIEDDSLPFASALALQCYTNEYVYFESDEETLWVERLQQKIAGLVELKQDVPAYLVVTLGAYRYLHQFPWAQSLADLDWDKDTSVVIERQISEPLTELTLRTEITCLTRVVGSVSQSVREQYEENPYPRWVNTRIADKGKPIGAVLKSHLHFEMGDYQSPESPEILIAGCGTGQHALNTASYFKDARVLAVDLSLSSLSYAMRKTNELGFSNIDYAQADIMELSSLERQFDLIESVGVLHHLGDPLAGWQILVDLLRPGGLMKIGLYSETARQSVVEGRSLISEKGYTASAKDISQCRQDFIAMAEGGDQLMAHLTDLNDFYSLSECRDLLFHVQEHRFTLPQVKAALTSLKLEFLGFEMSDQSVLRQFKETYLKKNALTSLSQWHEFELKNPDTFIGMYQFWCQKRHL